MTSLTKNPHPPSKKFLFECRLKDLLRLLRLLPGLRAYRTGEIPAESHVRLGVFFRKSPNPSRRQRVNLINDDAFVSAAMADVCSMVHLVCLFIKMHLLALLQDNCLDLVCRAFLRKLSACVRNIAAYCQHLLRPKYRPFWLIPIYQ